VWAARGISRLKAMRSRDGAGVACWQPSCGRLLPQPPVAHAAIADARPAWPDATTHGERPRHGFPFATSASSPVNASAMEWHADWRRGSPPSRFVLSLPWRSAGAREASHPPVGPSRVRSQSLASPSEPRAFLRGCGGSLRARTHQLECSAPFPLDDRVVRAEEWTSRASLRLHCWRMHSRCRPGQPGRSPASALLLHGVSSQ
jgi:hypothetical protein